MNLQDLEEKNLQNLSSQSIEVKEIEKVKDLNLAGINLKLEHLLAEQIAINNRILKVMDQSEKDKAELLKKLEESDTSRLEIQEKTNNTFKGMRVEIKELKETNYQKLEQTAKEVSEELGKNKEHQKELTN